MPTAKKVTAAKSPKAQVSTPPSAFTTPDAKLSLSSQSGGSARGSGSTKRAAKGTAAAKRAAKKKLKHSDDAAAQHNAEEEDIADDEDLTGEEDEKEEDEKDEQGAADLYFIKLNKRNTKTCCLLTQAPTAKHQIPDLYKFTSSPEEARTLGVHMHGRPKDGKRKYDIQDHQQFKQLALEFTKTGNKQLARVYGVEKLSGDDAFTTFELLPKEDLPPIMYWQVVENGDTGTGTGAHPSTGMLNDNVDKPYPHAYPLAPIRGDKIFFEQLKEILEAVKTPNMPNAAWHSLLMADWAQITAYLVPSCMENKPWFFRFAIEDITTGLIYNYKATVHEVLGSSTIIRDVLGERVMEAVVADVKIGKDNRAVELTLSDIILPAMGGGAEWGGAFPKFCEMLEAIAAFDPAQLYADE